MTLGARKVGTALGVGLALLVALVAAVAVLVLRGGVGGGAEAAAHVGDFRGVRLGMTARDLRARFEAPGPGSFEVGTTADRDGAVSVWKPEPASPAAGALGEVRFELHNGMLVAVVADLPRGAPEAEGPPVQTSTAAVRARSPGDDGRVRLELYARDCPTHRDVVEGLLRRVPR